MTTMTKEQRNEVESMNKDLMIKLKYDTISKDEMDELVKNLDSLIYSTIRKNYVATPDADVYQEIWKKILKSKHSWNEDLCLNLSTWIVTVAISVINNLRTISYRYNNRYCSYNTLENEENGFNGEAVALSNSLVDTDSLRDLHAKETLKCFFSTLDEKEMDVIKIIFNTSGKDLNKNSVSKYQKKKITKTYLRNRMEMDSNEFDELFLRLKKKFLENYTQNGK